MSEIALNIFKENIGKVVLVELKGGRSVRGKLYSFDQHMNLVLEDAEDITGENPKKIGTVIIRGDNVILVSPPPKKPEETQIKKQ